MRKRTPVSVSRLVSREVPAKTPGLCVEGGENTLALFLDGGEALDLLESLAAALGYRVTRK